jgi:hypothetical protein
VNDGHGAAGAARAELLAERTCFTQRDGCVIEPAGINRDLIPAMYGIDTELRPALCNWQRSRAKQRTEKGAMILGRSRRERGSNDGGAEHGRGFQHGLSVIP